MTAIGRRDSETGGVICLNAMLLSYQLSECSS
jgi:hypothetical protein